MLKRIARVTLLLGLLAAFAFAFGSSQAYAGLGCQYQAGTCVEVPPYCPGACNLVGGNICNCVL